MSNSLVFQLDARGTATPILEMRELQLNWFNVFVGSRLLIQADVTEASSGTTESANNTEVMFVHSPYVIKYEHTAKYFKKDLPFEVRVRF